MINKKIFLAAPISGFYDETEYVKYREEVLKLIAFLRQNSFYVYSEVERVTDESNYDSPKDSVKADFDKIDESDVFLLLHPKKIQTSTLIELGYAYAKEKNIIIVGSTEVLPYLALGLSSIGESISIIDSSCIDTRVFIEVVTALNSLI